MQSDWLQPKLDNMWNHIKKKHFSQSNSRVLKKVSDLQPDDLVLVQLRELTKFETANYKYASGGILQRNNGVFGYKKEIEI